MDIEGTTSALPRRQWLTPPTGCDLVIALDTLIAGVHFLPDTPAADVGYKALAVNLSTWPRWVPNPCARRLPSC